jgi:ribonuclease Z
MSIQLCILGSGSATPTAYRNPTSQYLSIKNHHFLVDCGEGTQSQIRKNKLSFQKIDKIFISHLHGDHYLGLFGLLSTLTLNNREKPVKLYAPKDLEELLNLQKKVSRVTWSFELKFIPTNPKEPELIFEDDEITIHSFPLKHRVPTTGFVFREKPNDRKLIPQRLIDFDIPIYARKQIKKGADFEMEDGTIISNSELTTDPLPSKSFAFCSDTIFDETIIPNITGVDLLYHEATFLKNLEKRAKETKHSTSEQAAVIAKKAHVGKLIIGHFSSRYINLEDHLTEAKEVFENTELALENKTFKV